MSSRSEERALEAYPLNLCGTHYGPRDVYQGAYEQAEKDTIDRAIEWLEKNVWEYTGLGYTDLSNAFREAMEEK